MGIYTVDLEVLDQNIAQMAKFEQSLETRLSALQKEIDTLHLTWTGLAATAQRQAHEAWTKGEAQMRQALTDLRAAAKVAHDNYTSAAETNSSMWNRVS